jgi:ketosteroid isomerase-like protein
MTRETPDDTLTRTGHFIAYATAFEKAFAADDWGGVEAALHEDAVYEVNFDPPFGGRFEGRAAVVAYMQDILERLDHRFDTREPLLLEMPREQGSSVSIRGRVRYTSRGLPDLVFDLDETATFRDGLIVHLADHYDDATRERILAYIAEHGEALGISDH